MSDNNKANGSAALTRDEIRTRLLSGYKSEIKSERLTVFGTEIELRQPTLGSILQAQDDQDPRRRSVLLLIQYACVPDTDERIFEEGDAETLLNWPFGEDLINLQTAISRLSGLDVAEAREELETVPLEDASSSSPAS